jgi:hypothetical protein
VTPPSRAPEQQAASRGALELPRSSVDRVIYRVEHSLSGEGPYAYRTNGQPLLIGRFGTMPMDDPRLRRAFPDDNAYWQAQMRSGCLSLGDLAQWFRGDEDAGVLDGRGFVVRGYTVRAGDALVIGRGQVLVPPDATDAARRCFEVPWETLLGEWSPETHAEAWRQSFGPHGRRAAGL